MKLKNNLYIITNYESSAPDNASYTLALQPECIIYKAHFPERPITPGVCLIQTAMELLEEHCGRNLHVVTVKNVKFLSILSPAETSEVTFNLQKIAWTEDSVSAQVIVHHTQTVYTKLSFTCCATA